MGPLQFSFLFLEIKWKEKCYFLKNWSVAMVCSSVCWVFTLGKRRKSKNLLFYLINELSAYLCPTYIPWNIGLRSLSIFHFSFKMIGEKVSAGKLQIFILPMSTSLPNVNQLNTRKEKTTITDTWYSDRFWSGLPVWSSKNSWNFIKKKHRKTFFKYDTI